MKKILSFVGSLLLISCSSTPKGEYSRSFIDRPYALPDDVASVEFGAVARNSETIDISSNSSVDDENEMTSTTTPTLIFEQGISNSVSWIYPLGLKWGIFNNENHTLGAKLASFLIYTTYSFDYWYRVSNKFSVRPHFTSEQLTTFFVNDRRNMTGLDLIYQANNSLALITSIQGGSYEGYSPFLDAVIEDITGEDEEDIEVNGDLVRYGIGAIYSLSESWDVRGDLMVESIEFDDFTSRTSILDLSFVYFY